MERKMRPYQARGKADIFKEWQEYDASMFVLATGGGKTFTFTEVIREFVSKGMRTMLIAHREELILQSWQTLYDAKIMSGIIMSDQPTNYSLLSQVCSIQTIVRRKKLPHADLIVIDEGHHVTDDNSYSKILNKYPNAKVLIVTATPYRLSGKGFENVIPGKSVRLIINCTTKELINDGYLVPIKYMIGSTPDMSAVQIIKGEFDEEETAKVMSMAPIVESYLEHVNGQQGICFCVNVAHSKEICRKYNEAGIKAVHIDANTPKDARRDAIKAFKEGEIKVCCNVAIFTEGTDFPVCQFVQLAAPSKSLSRYFQEVGRALRTVAKVDLFTSSEERKKAISESSKPFATILDNAGMWRDHPFPDDEIDWEYYFKGWKKDKIKKDEEPEYIEIPVYEVEDPKSGSRKKTQNIDEVNGMILIEITSELRRNIKSIKHLSEFDRLYKLGIERDFDRVGYFAYYKYRIFCDSQNIQMEDTVWKYLENVLCDNVDKEKDNYISECRANGVEVNIQLNATIKKIESKGVHRFFLTKQYHEYKAGSRIIS